MTRTAGVVSAATAGLAVAGGTTALALATTQGTGVPGAEATTALVLVASAGMGLLIAAARPGHPVGRLLLGGSAVWGAGEAALALAVTGLVTDPGSVPGAGWLAVLGTFLRGAGWLVLILGLPLLFPDGRLPPPPWRWSVPVAAMALVAYTATSLMAAAPLDARLGGVDSPLQPPAALAGLVEEVGLLALGLAAVALAGAVGGLAARWRAGSPLTRQQLVWFTCATAVPVIFVPLVAADLATPVLFGLAVLPLPVAIAVAVLQHRLYDVQLVASRTLAAGALSGVLAIVYVTVVGGVGALLEARGARWLPWLATGAVAVSFAPLRDALQRGANRLAYGRWADPEAVLASVRRRVADAGDAGALLPRLVRELGEGLGLARIVVLDSDGHEMAAFGAGPDADEGTPLTVYGRPVGTLRWSSPRRPLRASDRRLLDDIAGHLGALVHAVALLARLRSAQERLVLAREDERRRLRRDLHDGLGSALAGMTFTVEAARNLLRTDVDAADAVLQDLRGHVQATVLDVRRVVDGLRPPALEELGLVGALSELRNRLSPELPDGISLEVAPDLPALTAAAEVATYRIGQEAVTNVVRHSGARRCRMSLCTDGDGLVLEVTDDGSGAAGVRPGGTGVPGMVARAEELGGTLAVEGSPAGGTTVRLRLPLPGGRNMRVDRREVAAR